MPGTPQPQFFNTGDVAIHHVVWPGHNPRLLFIHGITGRLETWLEIGPQIAGGHGAAAVDLRGHGRSGHVTGHYQLADYARDMAALIRGTDMGRVMVIGHSLGAMTALALASAYTELVDAVVLEDPPLFAREIMEHDDPARFERFQQTAQLASSSMTVDEMVEQMRRAAPDALVEMLELRARNLFDMDGDVVQHIVDQRIDWTPVIEDTLRLVKCPVLLMQGSFELGAWMRDADGERAASLLSDCKLSKWTDTGHGLHSEHPERFADEVRQFLRARVSGFAE